MGVIDSIDGKIKENFFNINKSGSLLLVERLHSTRTELITRILFVGQQQIELHFQQNYPRDLVDYGCNIECLIRGNQISQWTVDSQNDINELEKILERFIHPTSSDKDPIYLSNLFVGGTLLLCAENKNISANLHGSNRFPHNCQFDCKHRTCKYYPCDSRPEYCQQFLAVMD